MERRRPDELANAAATAAAPAATSAAAPAATASVDSARNRTIFNNLVGIITAAGLDGLYTVDASGNPGGWLWDRITDGIDSEALLMLEFEQTPQFQQRYPAIAQIPPQRARR